MYIKYEDLDLFEFFEKEPVAIGDFDAGIYLYSLSDAQGFSITFDISIYEYRIGISVDFDGNIVFSGEFQHVVEIKKSDTGYLNIILEEDKRIILKKTPQIGVILE